MRRSRMTWGSATRRRRWCWGCRVSGRCEQAIQGVECSRYTRNDQEQLRVTQQLKYRGIEGSDDQQDTGGERRPIEHLRDAEAARWQGATTESDPNEADEIAGCDIHQDDYHHPTGEVF